jgi:hypothetical protein
MPAYNVVNPASLAAGQPEDVSQILANFNAIATLLNGGLDNYNIKALAGIDISKLGASPWTAITPAWSTSANPQPVLGNGAVAGRYTQIGKTVFFIGNWRAGTTTTYGNGTFLYTLPVSSMQPFQSTLGAGVGQFTQAISRVSGAGAGLVEFLYGAATWPTGQLASIISTPPWGGAWSNGDTIDWAMVYEAA